MEQRRSVEIAIIGAGVIGLACAVRLASQGRELLLIDPREPGTACSYGNAGAIAPYGCVPVGNPGVLRDLPKLLSAAESPLALRWSGVVSVLPWLLRFLRQSLPRPARANALALSRLLGDAVPAWRELAAQAQLDDLLRHEGCLYVYRNSVPKADWGDALRTELGIRQQHVSPGEVASLEPALPPVAGGILFRDALHIRDPGALTQRLWGAAAAHGAAIVQAAVSSISVGAAGRVELSVPALSLEARKVVLAAGAWSRPLARKVGDLVPLDTERGYHVEFPIEIELLRRPVCPIDLGFYLTPMRGRLRAAGTVELGGLAAPPDPGRFRLLEQGARRLLPSLGEPSSKWMGFRPSLPDSLPVIGRSRRSRDIVYAFGHGHLGMTLAAVTARHVAMLLDAGADAQGTDAEGSDAWAIAPFAAQRFGALL